MVLNIHRYHKAHQGKGVQRWGEREIIYLSLHCHHQNDFCVKVGSNESHFNVSNCEEQSHKTVSTDHNFGRKRRAKADTNQGPSAYQANAFLLSQTGSLNVKTHNLHLYTLPLQLHSSADTQVFRIPSFCIKSSGQHSFSYQTPAVWNQLPVSVHYSTFVTSFIIIVFLENLALSKKRFFSPIALR